MGGPRRDSVARQALRGQRPTPSRPKGRRKECCPPRLRRCHVEAIAIDVEPLRVGASLESLDSASAPAEPRSDREPDREAHTRDCAQQPRDGDSLDRW
jgi:hypothetical protein